MKVSSLLEGLEYTCCQGSVEQEVSSVVYDSRKAEENSLFICIRGAVVDGHKFVSDVVAKGAKTLESYLDQGKNIVFLTLGDPCVYSTFSYLQHRVEADGYHTELVSGITSFCAAAARLNVSLSEWNEQLHIVPAVHRLDNELTESGNYVLMKSGKKMNQVKEILAKSGRDVLMVENCGMPDEHIYHSVEEIPDDAGYYSLIIAKEHK